MQPSPSPSRRTIGPRGRLARPRRLSRNPIPALFYPERGEHHIAVEALALCAVCPVRGPCLRAALIEESVCISDVCGIRGGCTASQRRVFIRRRRRIA